MCFPDFTVTPQPYLKVPRYAVTLWLVEPETSPLSPNGDLSGKLIRTGPCGESQRMVSPFLRRGFFGNATRAQCSSNVIMILCLFPMAVFHPSGGVGGWTSRWNAESRCRSVRS